MAEKKYVKYGIIALVIVVAIILVVFGIKNRSSEGEQEIEGGLKSEETDEGQENVIDFEEVFGDQESDGQVSEEGESGDDVQDGGAQDGDTQDGDTQDGDTQDGSAQNGSTQNGSTQNGSTQNGGAQNGGTQGGSGQDEEDSKWGPLF